MMLFKKYSRLLAVFANTQLGRDYLSHKTLLLPREKIALLLPNGYIQTGTIGKDKVEAQLNATPYNCYEPKLLVALTKLDIVANWIKDFGEAKELLAWYLGLRHQPVFASRGWNVLLNVLTQTPTLNGCGYVRGPGNAPWATEHDAVTGSAVVQNNGAMVASHYATDNNNIYRTFTPYDTSGLTASATITGGANKIAVYLQDKADPNSVTFGIVANTQASETNLVTADYDQLGTTLGASATLASMSTGTTNDLVFNATGDSWISKTSYTKVGFRLSPDYLNSEPAGDNSCTPVINGANASVLTVTYTLPAVATSASLQSGMVGFLEF